MYNHLSPVHIDGRRPHRSAVAWERVRVCRLAEGTETGDSIGGTDRVSSPRGESRGMFALPARWRLDRRLGMGGQAEVWLAMDTQLKEPVAIKVYEGAFSGEAHARWRRELRLGRSLQHPHLIRIHELIETEMGVALAMEYLPGGSLAERLAKEGPFSPAQVEDVALHVLEALAYLHAHDIVHRDVKPANILLDEEGSLRLADLGVAKSLAPAADATRTVLTPGSPAYMSPEQIQNVEVGPPSDLYSLGVTLYELLTGKLPYEGKSTYEVATGHLTGEFPSPRLARPDCPRWLARFIRRLMEKRPEDRFPNAEAALKALETRRGLFSRRMLRKLALRSAALLIMVAFVTAGLLAWHREGGAAAPRAVRTAHEGNRLRGLDAQGNTLWTFTTLAPIQQVEQADLDGDGKEEVIVASYNPGELQDQSRSASAHTPPQVLIVSPEGRILNDFRPEEQIRDTSSPVAPPLLWPSAKVLDLLADGTRQILINAHHRLLGTAYLWLYWPKQNRWDEILDHWGGWIYAAVPMPGSHPPCLRLLGFNGVLASQPIEAELAIRPPQRGSVVLPGSLPVLGVWSTSSAQLRWYTPLSPTLYNYRDPVEGFTVQADGTSRFMVKGRSTIVDRWGNPVSGPNAGMDRSVQRMELLGKIGDLYWRAPDFSPAAVRQTITTLKKKFAALLREKPEETSFQQVCARALARAGDPSGGVQLLESALKEDGFNDSLLLNLGHLLAIQGNLAEARHVLEHGYLDEETPAGDWLCVKVLGRIAIEMRDERLLKAQELMLSNRGFSITTGEVLDARARLWWDDPIQAESQLGSYDLAPDGEAIACLTRWRLHEIKPEDVGFMTDSLQRNPDAAGECLIARAMARLSLGHPNAAVSDCLEAERRLSERAPCEFWAYQTMQLARACHAKALLASGRTQDAAALAKEILPKLRPGLLPYLLVRQVLASAESNGRSSWEPSPDGGFFPLPSRRDRAIAPTARNREGHIS